MCSIVVADIVLQVNDSKRKALNLSQMKQVWFPPVKRNVCKGELVHWNCGFQTFPHENRLSTPARLDEGSWQLCSLFFLKLKTSSKCILSYQFFLTRSNKTWTFELGLECIATDCSRQVCKSTTPWILPNWITFNFAFKIKQNLKQVQIKCRNWSLWEVVNLALKTKIVSPNHKHHSDLDWNHLYKGQCSRSIQL